MDLKEELNKIENNLVDLTNDLVNSLDLIFAKGVPEVAEKIVVWIPIDHRYNLKFTYMKNDTSVLSGDFSELSFLDSSLINLIDTNKEYNDHNNFTYEVDLILANWLKTAFQKSGFAEVKIQKVMAINNACIYFDLNTLEILGDVEMWE